MVRRTQTLPVRFIPEQFHIASMWFDVVDFCRWLNPAFFAALNAQGIAGKEHPPCPAPPLAAVNIF